MLKIMDNSGYKYFPTTCLHPTRKLNKNEIRLWPGGNGSHWGLGADD